MSQKNQNVTYSFSNSPSDIFTCTPNEGVTLYFEDGICVDIDVEPGVSEVNLTGVVNVRQNRLCRIIKLRGIDKSFPDVKKLIIGEDIYSISISNYMFPNVREVESESPSFKDGCYLIEDNYELTLLNSFCLKKGETVEHVQAWTINDYAFEGCEITDGFFEDNAAPTKIKEHAFDDSAFLRLPSENGIKAIGPVVFAYDDEAEEVRFKRLSRGRYVCPDSMPIKNVKRAVIDEVINMDRIIPLPETVVINKIKCKWSNISSYLSTEDTKRFEAGEDSSVCAKDGILYSPDMEYLIKCPKKKTGDIKIPEGVKYIVEYAFFESEISSVTLPSTLKQIFLNAFRYSKLSKIDFGTGIKSTGSYEGNSFGDCYNLKEIEIPSNITKIAKSTFYHCSNLEKVVLHEGLKSIDERAFMWCTSLKELTLPESIEHMGNDCFTDVETLIIPKVTGGILYAYSGSRESDSCPVKKLIIKNKNDYTVYIPKHISASAKYRLNFDCRCGYLDEELYKYVDDAEIKQDAAYYLYTHNDKFNLSYYDSLKKYLRRTAKSIAVRYLHDSDESKFIEFVKTGLLSKAAIKELFDTANKENRTTAAAYLLELIGKKKQSVTFKF